jgi:hypothetical protein
VFSKHNLEIYKVDQLSTHGGSLRLYIKHDNYQKEVDSSVQEVLNEELAFGINNLLTYKNFSKKVRDVKINFLEFLINAEKHNKKIIAYGAAAKGNTLLNYCGVKNDIIQYVVDASPFKQGKYLPGSHIRVVDESMINEIKPDYVLILPWNIKDEIMEQLSYIRQWNGKFVVPIPSLTII